VNRTLISLALAIATSAGAQQPALHWYRGNTHAHTLNSDGDVPPDAVARWYREHDYHFTFITDHEFATDVAPLNALFGAPNRFAVFAAQEITQRVRDASHPNGLRQAHVNSLGTTRVIRPLGERSIADVAVAETFRRNLAEIRAAGGVGQINHPNFGWSVRLEDLLDVPDSTLLEIANAHVLVNNAGGTDSAGRWMPSTEALWDSLLTRGKLLFGIAADDSHHYKPEDAENPASVRPGRAWIWVRADTLSPAAILGAIRHGNFYASTGVTLRDYTSDGREIRVDVAPAGDRRFLIEFIGGGGRVLQSSRGPRASYRVIGGEKYVRVRITDSSGRHAWTQPQMVGPLRFSGHHLKASARSR
jgi:hypothetical protein